jgi:tRNA (guanine-N7-)-methyltransferase
MPLVGLLTPCIIAAFHGSRGALGPLSCSPRAMSSKGLAGMCSTSDHTETQLQSLEVNSSPRYTPWNDPWTSESSLSRKRNNKRRFRQHVNPLSRKFQQPTMLSENWPNDVYTDATKPLHLDIGCAKGEFLLQLAQQELQLDQEDSSCKQTRFNYLGLEIRPPVALLARERISASDMTGHIDVLGCNANVDLDRILSRYHDAASKKLNYDGPINLLHRVTIQFPDPHFKSYQAKRRVVTPAVTDCLAKFMPVADAVNKQGLVFLQSDVQHVLDSMRLQFINYKPAYFTDDTENTEKQRCGNINAEFGNYLTTNIIGVPTERERSVMTKGLPVFRALLSRSSIPYQKSPVEVNQV